MNRTLHNLFSYAGVIRRYRIRVVGLGQSGFERSYTTSSRIELINDLQCCTSYDFSVSAFTIAYGPPTPTRNIFKTLPDIVTSKNLITHYTSNNCKLALPGFHSHKIHSCVYLIDPVQGTVTVQDPETLTVSWVTPQEISNQGLTGYQLAVTSQCFTDDEPTPAQVFNILPQEPPSQAVMGLRKYSII